MDGNLKQDCSLTFISLVCAASAILLGYAVALLHFAVINWWRDLGCTWHVQEGPCVNHLIGCIVLVVAEAFAGLFITLMCSRDERRQRNKSE